MNPDVLLCGSDDHTHTHKPLLIPALLVFKFSFMANSFSVFTPLFLSAHFLPHHLIFPLFLSVYFSVSLFTLLLQTLYFSWNRVCVS